VLNARGLAHSNPPRATARQQPAPLGTLSLGIIANIFRRMFAPSLKIVMLRNLLPFVQTAVPARNEE
jgi:hypothetical protein